MSAIELALTAGFVIGFMTAAAGFMVVLLRIGR